MRLDYRILWIDDQPTHVQGYKEGIERHLRKQGFNLIVDEVSTIEQIKEHVGQHVHNDGIDLVLVDYDLRSGSGGEQALAEVRHRLRYTDILFYSAEDVEKLRVIAFEAKLDGVYFSTRFHLARDAIAVVDKTLNRVMDIDHMRGVVMAATSDIDVLVEESLAAMYRRLEEANRAFFRTSIVELVKRKLEKWTCELEKAEESCDIDKLFKLRHLFTAADRLDMLIEQLGEDGQEYADKARTYRGVVVPRRNKLAHLVVKLVDGRRVLSGGEGSDFEVDGMRALRVELLEHRSNFQGIAIILDVEF